MSAKPIVLYSANTQLAYTVSQEYFGGTHYVWCMPNTPTYHAAAAKTNPPSSHPLKIMRSLSDAIKGNDRHCPQIVQNRTGLLRGAEQHWKAGKITTKQFDEAVDDIKNADIPEFKPLLYVIPYDPVEKRVLKPAAASRAAALSKELQIVDLRADEFDVLDIFA